MDHALEHLAAYESFFIASEKTQSISPSSVAFLACSVNNDALLMCAETPDLMETAYEVAQEGIKDTLEAIAHRIIRSVDTVLGKFKAINTLLQNARDVRIKATNKLIGTLIGAEPGKQVLSPDAALLASAGITTAIGILIIIFTGTGPAIWSSVRASSAVRTAVDFFKNLRFPFSKAVVREGGRLRITYDKMPRSSFMGTLSTWTTQKWDSFINAFSDIPKLIGTLITRLNYFISNAGRAFSELFIKPIASSFRFVPKKRIRSTIDANAPHYFQVQTKFVLFAQMFALVSSLTVLVDSGIRRLWRLVKSLTNYKEPNA